MRGCLCVNAETARPTEVAVRRSRAHPQLHRPITERAAETNETQLVVLNSLPWRAEPDQMIDAQLYERRALRLTRAGITLI